jgi:hypothetical protein
MSSLSVQNVMQHGTHARAMLSGGLGVFTSFLSLGWALFAYNLPSAVNVTSSQSQNLMLLQVALAFFTLLGSGLMFAAYTAPGGAINILGALGTFIIGIYYASGIANAAKANDLTSLPLHFSIVYNGIVSIPTDRIVSTLLIVPVLPIALLLLVSGLGGLSTYRSSRDLHLV